MNSTADSRPIPVTDPGPAARRNPLGFLDAFLRSPFAGIAPWALLSILSGPGRFEASVAAALGFSLLVMALGRSRGIKIHMLEVFGAVFFAGLAVVGLFASTGALDFLELWAGEMTNVALAVLAWFGLAVGKPFTMAYAKDNTPEEYWGSALFKKINVVITTAWASAFTFAAVAGFVGDLFFHDAGNFWTGWILQLAAIFAAVSFTEFYPDYATAKFDLAQGRPTKLPSLMGVIAWLPTFVTITGIAGLVTDSTNWIVGVALIVAGGAGARWLGENK